MSTSTDPATNAPAGIAAEVAANTTPEPPTDTSPLARLRQNRGTLAAIAVFVLLAVFPYLGVSIPGLLPGPSYTAGTQQLLGLCFLIGALALTYNLMFGTAGLMSFGHALPFAASIYLCAIALEHWGMSLVPAALIAIIGSTALSAVVGAISLRVDGIPFAMVTLAFAQAGSVLVLLNPGDLTGGEEGIGLVNAQLPDMFVGVLNTANLYWLALATLAVVVLAVTWTTRSHAGRLMAAVRDNERRVRVLGVQPYRVRLIAYVIASGLAALVGVAYLLLQGGASPQVTTADFTLSLLVMVVLGGVRSNTGAVLGGVIYMLADQRLTVLASSGSIASLPSWLRVPLSEPQFLLGVLFVLVVLFVPGGLAGAVARIRARFARRRVAAAGRADGDTAAGV